MPCPACTAGRNQASNGTVLHRKPAPDAAGGGTPTGFHQRLQQAPVSQPGDPEERQADRVAESILTAPVRTTPSARALPSRRTDGLVARELGPGAKLSPDLSDYFGSRLGSDLGGVRVHTGTAASLAARSVQARAFTDRQDIVFGAGEWAPHTTGGRQLLAHELAHTLQPSAQPGGAALRRDMDLDPDVDVRTNRQVIEDAVKGKSVGDAKKITNYAECTEDERIQLIDILLNQTWVGPFDEYALEGLWRSAGDGLVAFAEKHTAQWFLSIEKGAELTSLPPVKEYCATFEAAATDTTKKLLADSETRIKMEMVRYGLTREDQVTVDPGGVGVSSTYGMAQGPAGAGLKAAAGLLLKKRHEVAALAAKQKEFEKEDEVFTYVTDMAQWTTANQALTQAQQDQEILRMAMEAKYPILAAYATDDDGLRDVAEGTGSSAAETLHKTSTERLENIAKVRQKIDDKAPLVWKLPPVLEATKSQLGIEPKSLKDGFVTAQVDKVETDSVLVDLALGAVALAFGLLAALPTGGGSLLAAGAAVGAVGAVATSATAAFLHIREYQFKAAASGTDFDKARAVSSDDPSLFWLALDIVAVVIDLNAAVGVFKALSPAARAAALASRENEAALKALRDAAEAAAPGKGAELADRVGASAKRLQKAAGSVEETFGPAGAKSVDKTVADVAAKQAAEAKTAIGVTSSFGGELKVTPLGLFTCASPCSMLRERYIEQLVADPNLGAELAALEKEAAAAAGDSAKLTDIAARGSALEGKLRAIPTGTWRSPLEKTAEYAELLKQRGSAVFELDRRPPGWHGTDEAAFRYGDKAAAETGYHWRLDSDGGLVYVRNNADLPERIFDPVSGSFRPPDVAPLKVALESEEELAKLAAAGAKATTKAEWLASIRQAAPAASGLSDEALLRVMGKSPNLDHMRGELLEALAGPGLAKRAASAGAGAEFVEGHRITDAAGRQLSDGMVIRRTGTGEAEVLVVGESKAGEGAAGGLSADYESFAKLKPGTPKWAELESEAIERLREKLGVAQDDAIKMPAWAEAANLRKTHKAEIEAMMRDINSRDVGQIERDFERLMPNFGAKDTTILIDGKPVRVKVNRATTKLAAAAPTDVALDAALQTGKDAGITVEALDVGVDSATLETIARQLRAEQIKNGVRFP